jgi:hypothetical protein
MLPDDDFLSPRPARRESVTAMRIALMAVLGCLILLSVLVFQARAAPDSVFDRQIRAGQQTTDLPASSVSATPRHLSPRIPAP